MIVPILKPDLFEAIQATVEERLSCHVVIWSLDKGVANTSTIKKDIWSPVAVAKQPDPDVGHRGAKLASDKAVSCEVTATISGAVTKSNKTVAFPGMAYRNDHPSVTQKVIENVQQSLRRKVKHFEIKTSQFKDPVFVCSSNSIGDRIKVALTCNLHRSAARCLVTTCINELLAQGAQTLFFMSQCAGGQLSVDVTEGIEEGLASGCKITGATLLEKEFTQSLSVYTDGSYYLSGFALGIVEKDHRLPRPDQMRAGDLVIGIQSPGSYNGNNLSLLEEVMENHSLRYTSGLPMSDGDTSWGEMIMKSTMVFSLPVLHALQSGNISACIPITDGGLVGSILRYLPGHMGIIIEALCWKIPAVFSWLYKEGELSEKELVYNFNCGLGALLIAQKNVAHKILADIQYGEEAWMIGSILHHHADSPRVQVRHFLEALKLDNFQLLKNVILNKVPAKISQVAVLISTAGTRR
ncbi:Trifunctional purine biosynthetic protein adenosine-3, partial [Pristimantis euphronides]